MTRATAIAARAELERTSSPHALLAFMTITHPALAEPLRVVSDAMDYTFGGALFIGMPFGLDLLPDSDATATTQLRMQNVDRRIGQALRSMTGRATVQLQLMSSVDFDLTQDPRTEIGSAAQIYGFAHFSLRNVTVNATEVTGEVIFHDYSTEPFPHIRATQDRLPGLFR